MKFNDDDYNSNYEDDDYNYNDDYNYDNDEGFDSNIDTTNDYEDEYTHSNNRSSNDDYLNSDNVLYTENNADFEVPPPQHNFKKFNFIRILFLIAITILAGFGIKFGYEKFKDYKVLSTYPSSIEDIKIVSKNLGTLPSGKKLSLYELPVKNLDFNSKLDQFLIGDDNTLVFFNQ